LSALFKKEAPEEGVTEKNIIINALRTAKSQIDGNPFSHFDSVIEKVKLISSELGIEISDSRFKKSDDIKY
jgi:hypothetical protein